MNFIEISFTVVSNLQNIPDLILLTLFSNGMSIILLFVAPFVLPSVLPDPDDLRLSHEERENLHAFLDHLFIGSWLSESLSLSI